MADNQKTLEILLRIRDLASGELKTFQKGVGDAGKTVETSFTEAGKAVSSLRNMFALFVGVPMTIQGIVTAVKTLTKESIYYASELKSMASSMGMTTDQVQVFRAAAIQTGTDLNLFQAAIFNLSRELDMLRSGNTESILKFRQFGITVDEVRNGSLTLYDAFGRIANRLGTVKDESKRTAVALDIFSRTGARLSDVFKEAGGDFGAFADKLRKEFSFLNSDAISQLDRTRVAYDKFIEGLKAKWRSFVVEVAERASVGKSIEKTVESLETLHKAINKTLSVPGAMWSNFDYAFLAMYQDAMKLAKGGADLNTVIVMMRARMDAYAATGDHVAKMTDVERKAFESAREEINLLYKSVTTVTESDKKLNDELQNTDEKLIEVNKSVDEINRTVKVEMADALFTAGGNWQIYRMTLEEINRIHREDFPDGIEAVNNALDQLKVQEKAYNFKESWTSAMNYATNTSINWEQTLVTGINNVRGAMSDMMVTMITRSGEARKIYQEFLKSILKMITDMMAQRAVASFITMMGFGAAGKVLGTYEAAGYEGAGEGLGETFAVEKGGIIGRFSSFQRGGITSGPTLGLIGEGMQREAVVPLPDNRSIPVKFADGGGRAVNVTFNIMANDTAGFDSLLAKRKPLITGMIAEAMQSNRDFRRSMS